MAKVSKKLHARARDNWNLNNLDVLHFTPGIDRKRSEGAQ